MRAVDRKAVKPPKTLAKRESAAERELNKIRAYFAAPVGDKPEFSVYKADSVKTRLNELFYGKCAYCESFYASTAPVDVEHYRPKGAVHEVTTHPGYWWLAMDWENLLPSCIDCNRKRKQKIPQISSNLLRLLDHSQGFSHSAIESSGKKDSFPILGARATTETCSIADEIPLLLDPCRDNPLEHIEYYFDHNNLISLILPKPHNNSDMIQTHAEGIDEDSQAIIAEATQSGISLKGAISIHVYGLNRLGLVQDRTRILRQLEFLEYMSIEIGKLAQSIEDDACSSKNPKLKMAADRLYWLQDQILQQMKKMAQPEEPHSSMVKIWISEFLSRLR